LIDSVVESHRLLRTSNLRVVNGRCDRALIAARRCEAVDATFATADVRLVRIVLKGE
jgi:hypothetical protein